MLLQGGVLVGVKAGDGAGVGGHGEAPGSLLPPGRLSPCIEQAKTWDLTAVYSPPDGFIGAGWEAWGTVI